MSVKSFIIALLVSVSIISCNSNVQENSNEEQISYVAKIDTTMTLAQIAKLNNIGEPYLRSKLDIPKNIGRKYTIIEMSKRFKFTIDELRQVIEERKNKQALRRSKKAKSENK